MQAVIEIVKANPGSNQSQIVALAQQAAIRLIHNDSFSSFTSPSSPANRRLGWRRPAADLFHQ